MTVARWLAFALAAAFVTQRAEAQSDTAKARVYFDEGVALAKQEKWTEALERFEASRALVERPSTVFNIGTTLMRLERPRAAIKAFEEFLAVSDRPDQAKAAEDLISEARGRLVSVELTIEPRGATLSIGGETIAPNGRVRKAELDPGRTTLAVRADGFNPLEETLELEPGAHLVRTIALEPISAPPPAVAEVPPPPPPTAPLVPTTIETEEPETEPSDSILASPWFWVVAGVVVVGTAVGVGVGVASRKVADPITGSTGDGINP